MKLNLIFFRRHKKLNFLQQKYSVLQKFLQAVLSTSETWCQSRNFDENCPRITEDAYIPTQNGTVVCVTPGGDLTTSVIGGPCNRQVCRWLNLQHHRGIPKATEGKEPKANGLLVRYYSQDLTRGQAKDSSKFLASFPDTNSENLAKDTNKILTRIKTL